MPTLIGISDALFDEQKLRPHYNTNKIGGLPAWPSSDVGIIPRCSICGGELSLVVQLYCPLEGSDYHRTLYVFGCILPSCWNKSDSLLQMNHLYVKMVMWICKFCSKNYYRSWVAFRCQVLDASSIKVGKVDDANTRATDVDEWGGGGDDWGVDADNWGVDGGDWGEPEQDSALTDSAPAELVDSSSTEESDGKQITLPSEKPEDNEPEVDTDILDMQQMCIEDIDNNDEENSSNNSQIIAEDLPSCLDEQRLASVKEISVHEHRPSDMTKVLTSYFIDVFDEPTNQSQADGHVTELLRNYQQQEGIQSLKESLSREGGVQGGGGGGEKYEKAMLVHKDAMFHKFVKRLSACPEQCVRYEWNGTPLYMRRTTPCDIPTTCAHCQGPLVFEVQLMPALVNILKLPGFKGTPVEFGTVIVYTCKQSCWEASANYRTEKVVVQADPDQDRFKV